jgi:hypothetical protein
LAVACDLRILVYEYVDNGNLEQWLHGDVGAVSPLTWDIRMNIVLGMAKGCLNFFFPLLFVLLPHVLPLNRWCMYGSLMRD